MKISDLDIDLVNSLHSGDSEAFDLIYQKYSKKLYSFGLKYLGTPSEAEELVQNVFVKIWENHKLLKKELSFKSYLFTIAYNEICKYFRKNKYEKQFVEAIAFENSSSTSNMEEGIDFKSIINRVDQILESLPERQRIAFKKSRIEGMATKDIANELKLSPGTVDNYISETSKFLKSKIKKEDLIIILFLSLFVF